jgi:hypothetical protein
MQKARSIRTTGINSDLQTATLPARSGPLGIWSPAGGAAAANDTHARSLYHHEHTSAALDWTHQNEDLIQLCWQAGLSTLCYHHVFKLLPAARAKKTCRSDAGFRSRATDGAASACLPQPCTCLVLLVSCQDSGQHSNKPLMGAGEQLMWIWSNGHWWIITRDYCCCCCSWSS